jgi:hypothetical protein
LFGISRTLLQSLYIARSCFNPHQYLPQQ